jgi:pimeloyl-ACP methyl ester carboxylesterase
MVDFLKSMSPVNKMMFLPPECTYDKSISGYLEIPHPKGWVLPATLHSASPKPDYLVIFCHGNAMDLGQCDFLSGAITCSMQNVAVLSFDYSGYGLSGCKSFPSERSAKMDIQIVYDYVRFKLCWPASRIIIFGQSIGSGVATHGAWYASQRKDEIMGLFLLSGYTSIRQVAASFVGVVGYCIFNRFNNLDTLKKLNIPLLLAHGNVDEVIPFPMSQTMNQAYTGHSINHFYIAENRGHNDLQFKKDCAIPLMNWIRAIEEYRAEIQFVLPECPCTDAQPQEVNSCLIM